MPPPRLSPSDSTSGTVTTMIAMNHDHDSAAVPRSSPKVVQVLDPKESNGSSSGLVVVTAAAKVKDLEEGLQSWRRGSIECRHVKLPLLDPAAMGQHGDSNGVDGGGGSGHHLRAVVGPAPADEIL